MSNSETHLKKALIDAIKNKVLQKLEFKKELLKTVEEAVKQDIENIENNFKHLENLDSEALISAFSQLKVPELTPFTADTISTAIDNISSQNSQLFCGILNGANSEFFMKTSFKNSGNINPNFVPPMPPFFQAPMFGQQFPHSPNFGFQPPPNFQPPFNFQNPPGPFPGFQGNQSPTQQSSGRPNNSEYKKFLIQKLESVYEKLGEQKISEELLTEFDKVITKFKKY